MPSKRLLLVGLYLALFANSIVTTVLYPFASKMVTVFGMADDRSDTGYWVGALTFTMMFGRTISSTIWGSICDKWGRRPPVLIGMISIITFSLSFGFSQNMTWALASRFCIGLFTPLDIAIRSILSEICPGKEFSSAMAIQSIVYSFGNITGTILGGLFEDPKSKGWITSGVFADNPFLLPNAIVSFMAFISLLIIFVTLKETLKKSEMTADLIPIKNRSIFQIVADPLVHKVIFVGIIAAVNSTAFHQISNLWFWASVSDGGFGMDPSDIGLVLAASSAVLLVFQKPLYARLIKRYGVVGLLNRSTFVALPLLIVIPAGCLVNEAKYVKWAIVVLICVCWHLLSFINCTTCVVVSNNSVIAKERGRLNGLYQLGSSTARSISPIVFGSVFALTVESKWNYPFNFAFSFYLMAFIATMGWLLSKNVPFSLDKPKEEAAPEENYTQLSVISKQ